MKSAYGPDIEMYSIMLIALIEAHDPRDWNSDEAKRQEIEGIIKRVTRKVVCKEELKDNANILRGIRAIKEEGTGREVWKARFLVQ